MWRFISRLLMDKGKNCPVAFREDEINSNINNNAHRGVQCKCRRFYGQKKLNPLFWTFLSSLLSPDLFGHRGRIFSYKVSRQISSIFF